jgi:uroporphyrinogen-III synthase
MCVLITRPIREAQMLAESLRQRGHETVIAPLFRISILHPPPEFAAALAASQAVLLSSANGARALAEASEQRSKPVFAVGDATAAAAEGLGFSNVASASGDAAALGELVRERLDPKNGPLVHVSGIDVTGEIAEDLAPAGFEVRRFALYEALAADPLPDPARAALQARGLDAATFFSPRSSALFVRQVGKAGLAEACGDVTAIAISAAAAKPLQGLPFKGIRVASRPTRQAMLDEIDLLANAVVQVEEPEQHTMSDAPPSPPADQYAPRRGLGVIGAFICGLVAAVIVLAAALFSLPYWPEQASSMWRGPPPQSVGPTELARLQTEATARASQTDAMKSEINARIDDLEKRVHAAATTAAQADRPPGSDPAIADLRSKIEALENQPAARAETEKEMAALKAEIAGLRAGADALNTGEKRALSAARASTVIAIAARLSAALESGLPFATDLALLAPLAKDDAKLGAIVATLQPAAASGVTARAVLSAEFPAIAKAALADDVADDSFGQRLLAKLRGLVSLRRVGADVPGDSTEAKLARAEAAIEAGDIAKAVDIVKSLPAGTARATAAWLALADSHLAAQRAVDQLAAYAVSQLGVAQ